MEWWMWVVGGVLLLAAEVLTPGSFFLFFFGVGGILTGLLAKFGVVTEWSLEWIVWSAVSIVTMVMFRPTLVRLAKNIAPANLDTYVGETATAASDIAPGAIGHAELRGVPWTAENVGATSVAKGQRCRVVALEGLKLKLRAD